MTELSLWRDCWISAEVERRNQEVLTFLPAHGSWRGGCSEQLLGPEGVDLPGEA